MAKRLKLTKDDFVEPTNEEQESAAQETPAPVQSPAADQQPVPEPAVKTVAQPVQYNEAYMPVQQTPQPVTPQPVTPQPVMQQPVMQQPVMQQPDIYVQQFPAYEQTQPAYQDQVYMAQPAAPLNNAPAKRGRPKGITSERDFLSVDLKGRRQALEALVFHEKLRNPREKISLNSYILDIIDREIASKRNIIDTIINI